MRIALVQQHATLDLEDNLRRGLNALTAAAADGATLVCFAELAFEPFYPQLPAGDRPAELAQEVPGPITEAFSKRAAELGVVVVLNLYERDGDRCFDCSPVIDADGTLVGRTRMVHITDYACFHEQGYYAPGDTGAPVFRDQGRADRRVDLLRPPLPGVHARPGPRRRGTRRGAAGGGGGRVARRAVRGRTAGGGLPERLLHGPLQPCRGRRVSGLCGRELRLRPRRTGRGAGAAGRRSTFSLPTSTSRRRRRATPESSSSATADPSSTPTGSRNVER